MESPTSVVRAQIEIDLPEEEEKLLPPVAHDVVCSLARGLTKDVNGHTDYIKRLRPTETVTMCRIPDEVIQANGGGDYKPKLISIGPYHSPYHTRNKALISMQNLKMQYLSDLLDRSETNKVKKYMKAINEQLQTEKEKYFECDDCRISNEEFLKMLVLDGCFLVELLLKHAEGLTLALPGIDIHLLNHDMMLIENQVPFSVLKLIYQHTDLGLDKKYSLFHLAISYLDNKEKGAYEEVENIDHLLHLLCICRLGNQLERVKSHVDSIYDRNDDKFESKLLSVAMFILSVAMFIFKKIFKCVLNALVGLVYVIIVGVESSMTFGNTLRDKNPFYAKSSEESSFMETATIPTVKELKYAGVWFGVRYSYPYSMFFCSDNGSMNGGPMEINDKFFTEFDNMLFYEQIYIIPRLKEETSTFQKEHTISSYAVYMRNLVKTRKDIVVLRRHGILKTTTSHEDEEIASFFCKHRSWLVLSKMQHEYLREQFTDFIEFCSRGHNKRRAKLIKEYFQSTLAIVSFSGFMILSILTVIQTVRN